MTVSLRCFGIPCFQPIGIDFCVRKRYSASNGELIRFFFQGLVLPEELKWFFLDCLVFRVHPAGVGLIKRGTSGAENPIPLPPAAVSSYFLPDLQALCSAKKRRRIIPKENPKLGSQEENPCNGGSSSINAGASWCWDGGAGDPGFFPCGECGRSALPFSAQKRLFWGSKSSRGGSGGGQLEDSPCPGAAWRFSLTLNPQKCVFSESGRPSTEP